MKKNPKDANPGRAMPMRTSPVPFAIRGSCAQRHVPPTVNANRMQILRPANGFVEQDGKSSGINAWTFRDAGASRRPRSSSFPFPLYSRSPS